MFKFLIILFIAGFLLLFLAGFSIVAFLRGIFSGGSNRRTMNNSSHRGQNASKKKGKKIFSKEVGEYVDYEEVK